MHQRHEREEVRPDDIAGHHRHDADEDERNHGRDAEDLGGVGRAQDAAVLDGLDGDQDDRAEHEHGVDPQAQARLDGVEIQQRELPGVDDGIGREQAIQNIAGRQPRADRLHRRPGKPVAPDRDRRDQLAVADPGDGPVDRGAAGFVGKQSRDLGVGEGLDEAHHDGGDPDDPGHIADDGGNGADREQHQRRHAAGDPECAGPVDAALEGLPGRLARRSGED